MVHAEDASPESLLESVGWVRRLARGLVSDAHLAEDAAQDAWVLALEGRLGDEGSARGWLRRVVSNWAANRRRDERARCQRERVAARAEQDSREGDPGHLVALAERHRAVVEAVLALDEPLRSTVLLRYFRDHSSEEIARLQGLPASTVRNRLRRGLAQLRERLGARYGASSWSLMLAPLFTRPPALSAAGAAGGAAAQSLAVTLMSKHVKLAVAVAVAVAMGGIYWSSIDGREPVVPAGEVAVAELAPVAAGPDLAEVPGAPTVASGSRSSASAPSAPALRGRVVSSVSGEPIEGVAVAAWSWLDREPRATLTETDGSGAFALAALPDEDTGLAIRCAGWVERALHPSQVPRAPGATLELELVPAGLLDVEIVEPSGVPVADAFVTLEAYHPTEAAPFGLRRDRRFARADAAGRVRFAEVPCATSLRAEVPGGPAVTTEVDPASRRGTLRIVLEPRGAVLGHVLFAGGGAASGRTLELECEALLRPLSLETSPDGSYRFEDVPPGAVSVRDLASGAPPVTGELLPGHELELAPLTLPELRPFAGRVRCSLDYEPDAFALELYRGGRRLGEPIWLDEQGRFRSEVEAGPVLVRVSQHASYSPDPSDPVGSRASIAELGEVLRATAEVPDEDFDLLLDPGVGAVEARIAGLPEEARAAALHFYVGERPIGVWTEPGDGFLWQDIGLELEGGHFRSHAIRAGRYHMAIQVHGHGTAWVEGLEVAGGRVTDLGELVWSAGRLRGRVVDGAGEAVPDAMIALECLWTGAGEQAQSGPDGGFRIDGLAAGVYQYMATAAERGSSAFGSVSIEPGVEAELEIPLLAPASIRGHLTDRGRPAGGIEVTLSQRNPWGERVVSSAAAEPADGSFRFGPLPPGEYALLARSVGQSVVLEPGRELEVELEIEGARVAVEVLGSDGPVTNVRSARLVCVEPGPAAGRFSDATVLEDGWLDVAPFDGRCLLTLDSGGDGLLAALVLGEELAATREVRLPSGGLQVFTDPDTAQGPAPRLVLTGLEGDAQVALPPISLAREAVPPGSSAAWWYPCVPPGTTLRLEGIDPDGRRTKLELPSGAGRATWGP